MVRLDISGLPVLPSAAAAVFYDLWMNRIAEVVDPPRNGEVAERSDDGGVETSPQAKVATASSRPLRPSGAPPRSGEDLTLVFPPADHTHTGWRRAAIQTLAREAAPQRINAIASFDPVAISAALAYLESAEGLTGQYLQLDSAGAGAVLDPAP